MFLIIPLIHKVKLKSDQFNTTFFSIPVNTAACYREQHINTLVGKTDKMMLITKLDITKGYTL